MLPAMYEGSLPMARFDIFYNEENGDFKFCEINTDGTAGMTRDPELAKLLVHNPAHQTVRRRYKLDSFELFDTWVKTFMEIYDTYPGRVFDPHVVITDYLENSTFQDFEGFVRSFDKAGVSCEICDVREMTYKDGKLYSPSGIKIDAIYRRAVTADVIRYYDESLDFIEAVKNNAVCLVGAFDSQPIHTKWLFYVLHQERAKRILTEEEREFVERHVPVTVEFSEEYISLDEVRMNKDRYIIKPMDAYGSRGIYAAGHEYTDADWEKLTGEIYGKGYICQEYCTQYLTENIDYAWGDGNFHDYTNMAGLYTYRGKFAGVLLRMVCGDNIIVAHKNERTAPVFVVNDIRQ